MSALLTPAAAFGEVERDTFERLELEREPIASADSAERANAYLNRLVESILSFKAFWGVLSKEAIQNGADELHAIRNKIEMLWRVKSSMLTDIQLIGERVREATGVAPVSWAKLPEAKRMIEEFESEVLNRWQTLDDLEGILIEPFALSRDRLKTLAAKYPPPQSWYDETVNPFAPEESAH